MLLTIRSNLVDGSQLFGYTTAKPLVVRRVEIIEIECLSWAMVISDGMIELQCNHQPSHC
jgi:hypothetical protein